MKASRFMLFSTIFTAIALIGWPVLSPASTLEFFLNTPIPLVLVALIPLGLVLTANHLINNNNSPRFFSILAALTALAMVVRIFGAGVAGIEPIWAIVIIAAVALGSEAGFIVGVGAIALSAIATGGIGPWLPYQMTVAGAVGVIAGLLRNRPFGNSRFALAAVGFFLSLMFGWLMNLWFWPTAIGISEAIAFDPTADVSDRMVSWLRFNLVTSLGFDLPRAFLTASILSIIGPRLILAITRATRVGATITENALNRP